MANRAGGTTPAELEATTTQHKSSVRFDTLDPAWGREEFQFPFESSDALVEGGLRLGAEVWHAAARARRRVRAVLPPGDRVACSPRSDPRTTTPPVPTPAPLLPPQAYST